MREFFIIAYYNFKDIVNKGFFKISTLFITFLILGCIFLPDLLYKFSNSIFKSEYLIYILDDKNYIFKDDREINLYVRDINLSGDYYFSYVKEERDLDKDLKEGKIDGYINVNNKKDISISGKNPNELRFILDRFIYKDLSYPNYKIENSNGNSKIIDIFEKYIYKGLLLMIIYTIFILYGQFIGFSIKSEKDSKILNVVMTKTKPISIVMGKIFGSLFASLLQIIYFLSLLFIIVGLLNEKSFPIINRIINFDFMFILRYLLYFISGFILYGLLFNVAGLIINKIEDLSIWIIPIVFIMSIGYFCVIITLQFSGNYIGDMLSFIPFISPFMSLVYEGMSYRDIINFSFIAITFLILMRINIKVIKGR